MIVVSLLMDPTEQVFPPQLRTETGPVSKTLCSLVFRIPHDGQSTKTQYFSVFFQLRRSYSVFTALKPSFSNISFPSSTQPGARGSVVVKAPCYKPEGRGIASR
jgi:hypothetical protein